MNATTFSVWAAISSTLLAASSGAQPVTSGLIAYYPLKGDARDALGNSLNDAVTQNTAGGSDRFGVADACLAFNGTTSRLSVTNGILNLATDYTVSLWVRFADVALLNQYLIYTPNRSFGIGINYNDAPTVPKAINWAIGSGDGPGWTLSYEHGAKTNYASGQWYQIVFLKRGLDYRLFVNGVLESSATSPTAFASFNSGLDFGFLSGVGACLNGSIDDIRIYNRGLSDHEVNQLYLYEAAPSVSVKKSVKPSFSGLTVGATYQLQTSTDLESWSDEGSPFVATDSMMVYPQYFDVENWADLYFQLRLVP